MMRWLLGSNDVSRWLILLALLPASGCIQSVCYRDADCPTGKYCDQASGKCKPKCVTDSDCVQGEKCVASKGLCVEPQCQTHADCGAGAICVDYQCIPGCAKDADCPDGKRCFESRCVAFSQACNCPLAPEYCVQDINPVSPSFGSSLCLPDSFPHGAALFFGSVGCSHCRALLSELLTMKGTLQTEGLSPQLVFVQLKDYVFNSDEVEGALDGVTVPVLHDTPELGIWQAFGADWYHFIVTDAYGCLVAHYGPLTDQDLEGDLGDEILGVWRDALQAQCTPPPEPSPEDGLDVVPEADEAGEEIVEDSGTDAAGDLATEASDVAPTDSADGFLDTAGPGPDSDTATADAGDASDAWVDPFELTDVCQVAPGPVPDVGYKLPHFLCKDVNPGTPTFGGPVSDITLKEKVWIAYFGSCT